jgi:outer membrane protein OmpA-like peptidoglycan-associated protein
VTVELGGGALVLAGEVPAESNRTAAVAAAAVVVGDPAAVSDQLTVDPEAIVRALLSGQPPVTFRTAYSTLDPAGQRTVAEIAQILKDHPTVHVRVLGFTDDVGAADMNYGLSYARARTVYLLLQRRGVPRSQLTFQAFGEKRPAVPNTSAANRAANRRVEFEVRR